MATQKQKEANRKNAKLSTGPCTPDGKTDLSRMNALKHGIDCTYEAACGEDRHALAARLAEYDREFQPLGVVERLLVDLVARKDWMLRRHKLFLSAELTNYSMVLMSPNKDAAANTAAASPKTSSSNNCLHRHIMDTERSYFRHLKSNSKSARPSGRQHRDHVALPVTDSPVTNQPRTLGSFRQSDPPGPPLPRRIVAPAAQKLRDRLRSAAIRN